MGYESKYTNMSPSGSSRISVSIRETVGDALRRVVRYDPNGYEVTYQRADFELHSDDTVDDRRTQDARLEALSSEFHRSVAPDGYGELSCMTKYFEHTVEINVPVTNTRGVLVTIDADVPDGAHAAVSEITDIVNAAVSSSTGAEPARTVAQEESR